MGEWRFDRWWALPGFRAQHSAAQLGVRKGRSPPTRAGPEGGLAGLSVFPAELVALLPCGGVWAAVLPPLLPLLGRCSTM